MNGLDDRLAAISRVLADPPPVHPLAPGQVWNTDTDCYDFIARHCPPGASTLETGLGVSTVLFVLWGARHTCIVGEQFEVDTCLAYLESRSIPIQNVSFVLGGSDQVLPKHPSGELDLFLIDGGHGFPTPVIDWFYGARWLRSGGILIVDDIQLPTVSDFLIRFLDLDPRWTELRRTDKWVGYRRESSGGLSEGHWMQPFVSLRAPGGPWGPRIRLGLRSRLGQIRRAVRSRFHS
jgi:hypothetical protein